MSLIGLLLSLMNNGRRLVSPLSTLMSLIELPSSQRKRGSWATPSSDGVKVAAFNGGVVEFLATLALTHIVEDPNTPPEASSWSGAIERSEKEP